jgi:hypothetical protein
VAEKSPRGQSCLPPHDPQRHCSQRPYDRADIQTPSYLLNNK